MALPMPYLERREHLFRSLPDYAETAAAIASRLGWRVGEVQGKLMGLRDLGQVTSTSPEGGGPLVWQRS